MPTIYPQTYDDDTTLRTVRDDASSVLVEDWLPGDIELKVEDSAKFNALGGYCTVYSFHDAITADKKATTFSYEKAEAGIISGLKALRNGDVARARGCRVVSNIMAEERNQLLDSVKTLQGEIGHIGTEDRNTIEWFANLLVTKVKSPRPWFKVFPGNTGFIFMPFRFKDQTSRLQGWQNISWKWSFGDGTSSEERDPVHVYERPGRYTVTLTVQNDYGKRTLVARNVITVMGTIPASCDVTLDPPHAIAGETVVNLSCRPAIQNDPVNPVTKIEWQILNGQAPTIGPLARVVFEKAGTYVPKVTQRTVYGNFSTQDCPSINVVERGSVWAMVQSMFNPEASFEEFSPGTNTWKAGKGSFSVRREWNQSPDSPERNDSYLFTGGMHDFQGTMSALILYADSVNTMGVGEYNGLTDTYRADPVRSRGWGWTSTRINTRSEDPIESKQVYVLFGRSNPDNLSETDLVTVEHYGMQTKTWEVLSLNLATEGGGDADLVQELANSPRTNKPRRWRSVNWGNSVYIMGSGANDLMTNFIVFKPSTRTWRSLPEPAIQGRTIDLEDCAPFSLAAGLYFADIRKFMMTYEPEAAVWRTLSGDSVWMISSAGRVTDGASLLKAASRSESPKIDHLTAYVTGFAFDGFVVFDEATKSATVLPYRKPGIVSSLGMF